MILALLTLASTDAPDSSIINNTALIVAVLSFLGAIAAVIGPIISKRLRGASDVREDHVAQNQTLKDAAEVAMKLVETIQSNASSSIEMVKDALNVAKEQLLSANGTISMLQTVINELRADNEENRAHNQAALAHLMAERDKAAHDRDAFAAKITDLEAQLRSQQIEEPTA